MNKIKLAFIAAVGSLLFACGGKTEVDFSIVPVKGSSGEYQYIDIAQKGKIVINPQFSEAYIFRDGLALVKSSGNDGKYGYIDKKGKYVIAPTYDYAQDFGEGVAWVQMEDQPPMLIDKKGKMLLQIDSLVRAYPFSNGMGYVDYYSEGEILGMFINKKGEKAVEMGGMGDRFSAVINDGLYAFKRKGSEKWGYKNKDNEIVINEQFSNVHPFFEGLAVVKSGNKWGAIDKKGDFVINPQYDQLEYDSDGLFSVKVGKKWGWINKKGEMAINPQFDLSYEFYGNKLAPVRMGSKWAYVDRGGQVTINPQFALAMPFNGDYAMVLSNDANIGFINKKGDFVVPPLYDATNDDIKEWNYAIGQKRFGLPIWYYFGVSGSDEDFEPYEKLREKIRAYQKAEAEAEAERYKAELEKKIQERNDISEQERTAELAKLADLPATDYAAPPSDKVCKPSFDCKKASTTAEKLICFGETCEVLASLDKKMSEVYKKAKAYYTGYESEELQRAQRKFVKDRDYCSNASCVENMYKSRISFLEEEMD